MFEIELKSPETFVVKTKERTVEVNIAESTIKANLKMGKLWGAGEFEIGDIAITGVELKSGKVMYRMNVEGVKIGLAGGEVLPEELDEMGPVDILGATEHKIVSIVEPKVVVPMGNMDFAEIKAPVNVEKKLKVKSVTALPASLTVYKLD